MSNPSPDDAQSELTRAREALHDAHVLLDGDGTTSGVLNRLYYAVFHAAQAVLYARGENPTSHGDVRRQFGQRVVLSGDASREEGRLLGTLYDFRQQADYGGNIGDVDVGELVDEVEAFVTHMESLVDRETSADGS